MLRMGSFKELKSNHQDKLSKNIPESSEALEEWPGSR